MANATIRTGGHAPSKDGDCNLYESPELKSKKYFDRRRKVIFVNGMDNSPKDHKAGADALSTLQACPVVGVYNKTDGFWTDLFQCLRDKLTLAQVQKGNPIDFDGWATLFDASHKAAKQKRPGLDKGAYMEGMIASNPATVALYRLLRTRGYDTKAVQIFAHSQGNLITSNALTAVALADGKKAIMGRVVNSFGSPCRFWPPGIVHRNHAFTFDPVSWMDYKFTFTSIKVGGVVAHGFDQYRLHDPEFVINRFRWGSFGFTANMDEKGLAEALRDMGENPGRLHGIFQRLDAAHFSDKDDVTVLYVQKMRAAGKERILRSMARTKPALIKLMIKCLTGGTFNWTSAEEKKQADFLKSLLQTG